MLNSKKTSTKNKSLKKIALFPALIILILFTGCQPKADKVPNEGGAAAGDVIVFHAGSLSVPMKALAAGFQQANPGVRILLEPAGSVACARKIADLKKPCDIIATSDYKVIENLLMPEHSLWHIPFATNEMVIAYQDGAALSGEINPFNWKEILLRPEVRFGRADPNSDPCGYRTVMVMNLACGHSQQFSQMVGKDQRYIRPKEVDLLALIEVGEIDYIFIYRSVAEQHGLKFVRLPDEVNLKDPGYAEHYSKVKVTIQGSGPGDSLTVTGEPMIYAVTRLENAPNPGVADAFLGFILGPAGQEICRNNGLPPLSGAAVSFYEKVPLNFRKFVSRKI